MARYLEITPLEKGQHTPADFAAALYDPSLIRFGHTVAAWHDLLGFGDMLKQTDWQLSGADGALPASRLLLLSKKLSEARVGADELLVINDAAVCTFSPDAYARALESRHDLLAWLWARFYVHCNTTGLEHDFKLPGLRTFICEGDVLVHRWQPYEVSLGDAANGAATRRSPHEYLPFSLQMNVAFTKCYLADSKGSKAGLKHGGIYIENSFLSKLTEQFGCRMYGDEFLFLTGQPVLSPLDKYLKTTRHRILPADVAEELGIDFDRSAWLKLGKTYDLSTTSLNIVVREIEAYSPEDESSLTWYDCFTGDLHGFDTEGQLPVEECRPTNNEDISDEELAVLEEFCNGLRAFTDEHGCAPQFLGVEDSRRTQYWFDKGDRPALFEQTPSGLFVPAANPIADRLPSNHPWRESIVYGDDLRNLIGKQVASSDKGPKGKAPSSMRVYRTSSKTQVDASKLPET